MDLLLRSLIIIAAYLILLCKSDAALQVDGTFCPFRLAIFYNARLRLEYFQSQKLLNWNPPRPSFRPGHDIKRPNNATMISRRLRTPRYPRRATTISTTTSTPSRHDRHTKTDLYGYENVAIEAVSCIVYVYKL
jgi:hypothetical protein